MDLPEAELKLTRMEERLRPILTRPINTADPQWMNKLAQAQHPLDEANIRNEAEVFLNKITEEYLNAESDHRKAIRELFERHNTFSSVATFSFAPTSEEHFRKHILLFSITDQGMDSRDAVLHLGSLCKEASTSGVEMRAILQQVARISSGENKYGMGSTRQLLLSASTAINI